MMYGFLIAADYNKQIQIANLNQLISNDQSILQSAQAAGEAEAKSYLRQKFDITTELAATMPWDPTATYLAHDTVYLTAAAFNAANTYALQQLVLYTDNNVYICTTAITVAAPWNPANWTLLGALNQLFYGAYPYPEFNYLSWYKVGAQVWWQDYTYIALQETMPLGPDTQFQMGFIQQAKVFNIFPSDPVKGPFYWGTKTAYTIPAGTLPTNTTFWTCGDNRDQQMILYFIDITLYHLHTRIAPQNIPIERAKRYHAAVDWLEKCATGKVTPELPVLQPRQGGRIRYGGQAKAQNIQ